MIQTRHYLTVATLVTMLCASCSDAPPMYTVTGTVTYQGQSVLQGQIVFSDADGRRPTVIGIIEQGRYKIETTAGAKLVRITATQETGRMIEGAMDATYPEVVDLIPEKYNSATTLQANIAPDGLLVIDFALE